jgi:hypothetical protein
MSRAGSRFEDGLVPLLEEIRQVAADLEVEGAIPLRSVGSLGRPDGYLEVVTESQVDWQRLYAAVIEARGLETRLAESAELVERGSLLDRLLHPEDPEQRPWEIWHFVLVPILGICHTGRPGWDWDEPVTRAAIEDWFVTTESRGERKRRTLAPLLNFEGPQDPLAIDEGMVIRPLSDDDRQAIWRSFGGDSRLGGPTAEDLERWSHTIELRWEGGRRGRLLGHDYAIERCSTLVRAMRICRPGMVGLARVWTDLYPPSPCNLPSFFVETHLHTPGDIALLDIEYPGDPRLPQSRFDTEDAELVTRLTEQMRESSEDPRLAMALRRFDSSYSRFQPEDSLIDLWIAFEALLIPDGQSELRYRASLRIAQLAASDPAGRQQAFDQARASYACRSKVVHGEEVKVDLGAVVDQTRDLARSVLRTWILDPPAGGVEGIDRSLLD